PTVLEARSPITDSRSPTPSKQTVILFIRLSAPGPMAPKPSSCRQRKYKEYSKAQLKLAEEALLKQDRDDRQFFNLAISVDRERFQLAKELVAEFRHKLHDRLANDSACERVIQINMQLFTTSLVNISKET
ncbi:MAG: DUF4423 domain-containing protein, partial [Proteobacteria bacterium]|nr:DUF4423 domain-containing protein [Pseudomonadota bacterium]